jgi:hypothetical protein
MGGVDLGLDLEPDTTANAAMRDARLIRPAPHKDRDEVGVGVADIDGGDRTDVAACLQLLGHGQGLRRIEAHAVVDGGQQRIQTTGAVLQQLLDFHQRVVGGIGTAKISVLSASSSETILFDE